MQITLFGTGYVGLVTGTCFAEVGNDVVCVDIDEPRVRQLQSGHCPIFEPGLQEMMQRNNRAGRLHFTTDAEFGVRHGDVIIIAVGTPSADDGSSDLRAVELVAASIGTHLDRPVVVVTKSTVPVGTSDRVRSIITRELSDRDQQLSFEVVANPEFLKEGAAIEDFQRPDRIIVGTDNPQAMETMRELYAPFNRNHNRLMIMDTRSAEFTKYAANAMLATKISFMNEMANIAERIGVDIEDVRAGIGSDPRIGHAFLYAGTGFGGSCFPKDVSALERMAINATYDAELLRAVNAVNERQKSVLFRKISEHFGGRLTDRTIAIWGLAFKPNTDDMRAAPSRVLIESLWSAGATTVAYDPAAMDEAKQLYPDQVEKGQLVLAASAEAALDGADALAICTEWRAFQMPDYEDMRRRLRSDVVFDGRNILDPVRMEREGITYYGIGRGETVFHK